MRIASRSVGEPEPLAGKSTEPAKRRCTLALPMSPVTTSVEELPENKVKLHVVHPRRRVRAGDRRRVPQARREVKIPGFRPGKAPRQLLEARLGTEVARDQALRDSLPEYYADAVQSRGRRRDRRRPRSTSPPARTTATSSSTPSSRSGPMVDARRATTGSGSRSRRPAVTDEASTRRSTRCATGSPTSRTRDGPLIDGDFAEIDIKGYVHDEAIDGPHRHRLPLRGRLRDRSCPKLDEQLRGKRPGDILEFNDTLPERFGERAGEEVSFQVLVKEAKRKVLPELTDEWVDEVSEFDTVDELRDDIRKRLELVRARCRRRWPCATRCSTPPPSSSPIDLPEALVAAGDGAAPPRPRAPARGAGR